MSLQLILGSSGSGKSYELYKNIIDQSIEHPEVNYMVIVPEQFTMQTQKELVSMHPRKGIMNIDILSFGRLAYRIFEEVGADSRLVLEETGKNLVLRRIAARKQSELKILGSNLKKSGYISEIKSIISELTQYNISPEQLMEMIKVTDHKPQLNYKLQDIHILYEAFKEYLQDKYITAEEILDVLCDVIHQSAIIRNTVIAIDGFTGFTPLQNKLLQSLMHLVKKIYVTVTIDANEDPYMQEEEHKLFYLSKKTISSLNHLAKEAKVFIEEPIMLGKKERYRYKEVPALAFLEGNIFRYGNRTYNKEQDEVQIHVTRNPAWEIHFVCRTILSLIREKGYRYKDFTVVTGDIEGYSKHLENIFKEYNIPCFIDNKRTILLNPFIEFIRSAMEITTQDYSYESVFRYLRCGLSDLTVSEVDRLENYVIALGIRGFKRWNTKWVRVYKGMKEEELEEINRIREAFIEHMASFTIEVKKKNATVNDYTKALYKLITSCQMQLKLKHYEEYFYAKKELALGKEYAQIYGIIMNLFDKVVELLGDEVISMKEYTQILEAGFEEAKVGIIPPSVDQVVVGDIERTRLKDIKVLFFVGMNDGIIPKGDSGGGIISQMDREALLSQNIELAPTARQNAYIQKLYLYMNMTKPSERLYLSYSKMNTAGTSLRPSYLISTVLKMFTMTSVIEEEESDHLSEHLFTYKNGVPYLILGLRKQRDDQISKEWMELYSCYYKEDRYRDKLLQLVEAAFYIPKKEKLSKAVANALYGSVLENNVKDNFHDPDLNVRESGLMGVSVTRLEKYAACAFAHFLNYGLHLSEREQYTFEPMDMGNIFHNSLELFGKKLEASEYDWFTIPEKIRDTMACQCVDEMIADYNNTILHSNARNEYVIDRMKRIMNRTIWALHEQVRKGTFIPSDYEVSFSVVDHLDAVNIALSGEERMKLRGRIDRMDISQDDDNVYVKVIDYKSGNTAFDMVALYHGLQLQLVVYLNAAMEMEQRANQDKNVIPAGIFYYNIQDPMIDKEYGEDDKDINTRILKQLKMNGLVNEDPHIIRQLDSTIEKSSDVIPVAVNKDGSLSKSSSVAGSKQFKQLSDYVNKKIKQIGTEILDGHIQIDPYELGDKTACDYCTFKSVCGFDKKTPGYEYRRLREYKKEEVWDKVKLSSEELSPVELSSEELSLEKEE